MKVKDLIEYLKTFDQEKFVVINSEIGPFSLRKELISEEEIDFLDEEELDDFINVILFG
jgi:BRCT domain type II-containing protein